MLKTLTSSTSNCECELPVGDTPLNFCYALPQQPRTTQCIEFKITAPQLPRNDNHVSTGLENSREFALRHSSSNSYEKHGVERLPSPELREEHLPLNLCMRSHCANTERDCRLNDTLVPAEILLSGLTLTGRNTDHRSRSKGRIIFTVASSYPVTGSSGLLKYSCSTVTAHIRRIARTYLYKNTSA